MYKVETKPELEMLELPRSGSEILAGNPYALKFGNREVEFKPPTVRRVRQIRLALAKSEMAVRASIKAVQEAPGDADAIQASLQAQSDHMDAMFEQFPEIPYQELLDDPSTTEAQIYDAYEALQKVIIDPLTQRAMAARAAIAANRRPVEPMDN
jgi:hypothetical protein